MKNQPFFNSGFMKKKIIALIYLLALITACSASKFEYKDNSTSPSENTGTVSGSGSFDIVSVDKFYCWINLMPGPEQVPGLNISGSLSMPLSEKYDIEEIKLNLIKIYQNGHPYFILKPLIRDNKRIKSEYNKEFIFSTVAGSKLVPGFNSDESITVEFIFDNDGETITYKIYDQLIEKAY